MNDKNGVGVGEKAEAEAEGGRVASGDEELLLVDPTNYPNGDEWHLVVSRLPPPPGPPEWRVMEKGGIVSEFEDLYDAFAAGKRRGLRLIRLADGKEMATFGPVLPGKKKAKPVKKAPPASGKKFSVAEVADEDLDVAI